jgi:hypothetical protein
MKIVKNAKSQKASVCSSNHAAAVHASSMTWR